MSDQPATSESKPAAPVYGGMVPVIRLVAQRPTVQIINGVLVVVKQLPPV